MSTSNITHRHQTFPSLVVRPATYWPAGAARTELFQSSRKKRQLPSGAASESACNDLGQRRDNARNRLKAPLVPTEFAVQLSLIVTSRSVKMSVVVRTVCIAILPGQLHPLVRPSDASTNGVVAATIDAQCRPARAWLLSPVRLCDRTAIPPIQRTCRVPVLCGPLEYTHESSAT